jgi:hypothetical protein
MALNLAVPAQEHSGGASMGVEGAKENQIPGVPSAGIMRGEMLYRELGTTGESVFVIGMGGSHLGLACVEEDLAIRLIHEAPRPRD